MAEEPPPPPMRLMNFVSEEQILRENRDKKDAEFNERFKHRPPKALDEDETEFLDNLEMSRREYERKMADEEARQLQSFQAAVAAQSSVVHELKETPPVQKVEEQKLIGRKNPAASRPLSVMVKVKPQAKKAKTDSEEAIEEMKTPNVDAGKTLNVPTTITSLVSYSDESDDD